MLAIKKSAFKAIVEFAHSELPNEACGYLAGKEGVITTCYKLTNADKNPEHFSFIPAEQFEVLKDARSKGLDIIANFHSHPLTPARPSAEDLRLAFDPDILYGIISLANEIEELKFFRIQNQEIQLIHYSII